MRTSKSISSQEGLKRIHKTTILECKSSVAKEARLNLFPTRFSHFGIVRKFCPFLFFPLLEALFSSFSSSRLNQAATRKEKLREIHKSVVFIVYLPFKIGLEQTPESGAECGSNTDNAFAKLF